MYYHNAHEIIIMNFTMWELNLCLGTHIPKRALPNQNVAFGELLLSLAAMTYVIVDVAEKLLRINNIHI